MKYVNDTYTNTLEIKQSKFIAYLVPYAEFKTTLQFLKDKHPKAPDFVVGDISCRPKELIEFLQNYTEDEWLNLQIKKSKGGNYYIDVNDWKKNESKEKAPKLNLEEDDDSVRLSDVPF